MDSITVKVLFQFILFPVSCVVTFDCLVTLSNFSSPQYRPRHRRCFIKKAVLKSFAIFTGNTDVVAFRPAALLKRGSNTCVFLGIL